MSSTNKTPFLALNSWLGSDIPAREDFNRDNLLIDSAMRAHTEDTDCHVTAQEKADWGQSCYVGSYTGDGNQTRTVTLGSSFSPQFGLLFAVNHFPSEKDFNNRADYNYFALFSARGTTVGVSLSGRQLTVIHSGTAVSGDEYRSFNESGVNYIYVVFK